MFENVKKVKYNGEILYNIVMKNYRKVSVNNMVCETLHPKNIIAKLYTSMFYENKIMAIEELNGCILENNRVGYSKAVKKIGKI
jgi:ornithine carbamoyltransferase